VKFCTEACGSVEDIHFLQTTAQLLCSRLPHVSHKITQVLPFLTLGVEERMKILVDYYKSSIDFEKFDADHSAAIDSTFDLFCILVDSIEKNDNGNQLKDFIISEKIVTKSIQYLTSHAPPLKSSLLATSEEWKDFTTRPALKYVLRILGGLSQHHASTQVLISRDCIPIVHGLEQVSSDAHVGTLAENLLEAIKQHPAVAEKIELVRRQTKEEKKKLAMAVRERQLVILGMRANERGQVIAKSKLLEQCQDLAEDTGLICNICREGYKFQPTKVLGIYTYTKRCVLDEFEMKPRKSYGYTTVTHFNTVHVECHMSAVRSARGRDEWDSAALQNANTRCNGLLPIWGPQVPESAYASALARHNSYLQDSTGYRDISYHSTTHDIRLQLLRFAQERSFSEDTGGGGPQSNLHLLPYMMQTALYMLNSTKAATREYKRALNFLEMSSNEVLENCYDVDGPYYWCSLALLVMPPIWWKKKRVQFLQRLIVCNHVRRVSIKPPAPVSDTRVRAYSYYKSALIYFAFIDSFYNIVFKDASNDDKWNQDWPATLADYLKHNEQTINDNIEVLLNLYQNSLLPCTTLERYFEIVRLDEITQANEFIVNTLESV
jgi:E3 ubiquitin-protein ligase UBR4